MTPVAAKEVCTCGLIVLHAQAGALATCPVSSLPSQGQVLLGDTAGHVWYDPLLGHS